MKTDPYDEHPYLKGTIRQSPGSSGETAAALPEGVPLPPRVLLQPLLTLGLLPTSLERSRGHLAGHSQRRAGRSHSLKQTHGQHAGSDEPHWAQRALGWSCCVGPPGPYLAASVRPPGLPGDKSPRSLPPGPRLPVEDSHWRPGQRVRSVLQTQGWWPSSITPEPPLAPALSPVSDNAPASLASQLLVQGAWMRVGYLS